MNGKSARKLFSMALALLMVIGVFPAPAQAAGLTISAPGHWDPYVSAGEIVLDAGDTLTIAQTAGSPASAVKIQVNGSCTINGFPGYIDKLYIVEKINTPMDVTLNNVHISAPANTAAYQQLSGTIHLIGDNELIAGSGQNAIIGSSLAITIDSSSGGTLAVRSGKAAITATPLIVKGDAQVKLNSSSSPSASASSYQVASGAELSMEGAPMGISTTSDVNIQNDGVMTVAGANANGIYAKNLAYSGTGTLTVSGTGAGSGINLTDSTGAALTINSGTIKAIGGATGNAVTLAGTSPKIVIGSGTLEMTNNALTSETHAFTMDAAGDPWTVLGTGVTHTGDLTGLSIDVTVPSGGAGTVRRGAAAAAPLDAPAGLAWDVSATGTVKAKWNAAPNAGIYRIELYKQGSVSPEYAAD